MTDFLDIETEREWYARTHVESPAELRRSAREVARRRQRKIDGALTCALVVVMIFLVCFTVGGMLMVFGYSWLT